MAKHTADILSEFGVTLEKSVNVITDNATNVRMAMTKMMVNFKWRPCSTRTLQLVINNGLDNKDVTDLSKMLSKTRSIVGHYRHSLTATTLLNKVQKDNNVSQHRLKQDVATRWNFQVVMLERLLEQRKAVTLCLAETSGKSVPKNLTTHEWSTAEDLVVALRPFLDITVLMSSARYPTLWVIIPVLDGLINFLKSTEGGLGLLKIFIELIKSKFGKFFRDEELCVATIMDTRFKAVLFTSAESR